MFNKPVPAPRSDAPGRPEIRNASGPLGVLNGKPAAPSPTEPSGGAPQETPENDKSNGARLIVGPEVKLKGAEIQDCDTLVVEGRVEATMDSRVIRIAEQGAFAGKVSIDIAEIRGSFEGELTARSQLIIHASGRVRGKIRYGKLVIDEGGELCGDINALSSERPTPFAKPAELPAPAGDLG